MGAGWIEELYLRHAPVVFRRARRLLADDQAAWDAVQEIFTRALASGGAFRRESSPTTWLYRITTNYCLNVLRDATRRQQKLAALAREAPAGVAGADPELRLTLSALMLGMPGELCEIAAYHHLDRMSQAEIAEVMGISRRTVGNRLKEFQERAQTALAPFEKAVS